MSRKHPPGSPARAAALERLAAALKAGETRRHAALYAGIGHSTLYEWLKDPDTLQLVEQSEAEARMLLLARVQKGAVTHWQAAAWLLERRWPDDYGRRNQTPPAPEAGKGGLDGLLARLRLAVHGGALAQALDAGDLDAARNALKEARR